MNKSSMASIKEEMPLVVIDSDCGSDDAMAIMLAFSEWGRSVAKVVAVTSCFGNSSVEHTSQNILRVLHACGETKVPVYRGSAGPLIVNPNQKKPELVHGEDGFGNRGHLFSTGDGKVEKGAVQALCNLAHAQPGKITLVTIGPLTNVALAHRLDPDFTKCLTKIVCLGGNYKGVGNTTEMAEFNFYCDVESAHIVLTEAECPILLIPWETMLEHGHPWDDFFKMINVDSDRARLLKGASSLCVEHCKKEGDPSFLDCDFLAMAAVLIPRCVTKTTQATLAVECAGDFTRGAVVCKKPQKGSKVVQIVQDFDDNILATLRTAMLKG